MKKRVKFFLFVSVLAVMFLFMTREPNAKGIVTGKETVFAPSATPEPSEEPEQTPAPSEEPEVTPAPSEEPEQTPAPSEEPEVTPAPSEEPEQTPAPSEEPEVTPAPSEEPTPVVDFQEFAAEPVVAAWDWDVLPALPRTGDASTILLVVASIFITLFILSFFVGKKNAQQTEVEVSETSNVTANNSVSVVLPAYAVVAGKAKSMLYSIGGEKTSWKPETKSLL